MEWVSGNIFIRSNPHRLDKAGDTVEGHSHNFDHTLFVLKGRVRLDFELPDGRKFSLVKHAPDDEYRDTRCHMLIHAGVKHTITAETDDCIVWCVFSHRNAQGEVIQVYNGIDSNYG